jgi:hypothetical protein
MRRVIVKVKFDMKITMIRPTITILSPTSLPNLRTPAASDLSAK